VFSSGLHLSRHGGGPDHYTSFGFQQEGDSDTLSEKWSMHVDEDGITFSYRPAAGEGRVIKYEDIEFLFVRIFFFSLHFVY
jgi:hypothetical protein